MNLRTVLYSILSLFFSGWFLASCEKEVEVDVPEVKQKLVVEGSIEQGRPPMVILTRTQDYFAETDAESFEKTFVHGADITVDDGSNKVQLQEICSSQVPDSLLSVFQGVSSLDEQTLNKTDFCIYTTSLMFGKVEETYDLEIDVDTHHITATTKIPYPVSLDSVWFKLYGDLDDRGFAWALLDDPDSTGNAYRWYAKRINEGKDGEPKDGAYIAPMGSVFEDRFFNSKKFEFNYPRGESPNQAPSDEDITYYYSIGDTIAVKFCSISIPTFRFYRTYEEAQANTGSPFASPTNIESNVNGALGVWAGFGATFDTVAAYP